METISLIVIYAVFFVLSIFLYRRAYSVKGIILFLCILAYFVFIEFYFRGINRLQVYLAEKGVQIDFGHAGTSLVLLWLFTNATGVLFVILILVKKWKIRADGGSDTESIKKV